jgi:hypothetical protein
MTARFPLGAFARACGFAAGWAVFTAVLLLATRPMGIGPGFSRPLPYAAAAILISLSGHLIRRWLKEGPLPGAPTAGGTLHRLGGAWLRGLLAFFKGTAAFNNFVFLSIAYILGIGLTSLFIRKEKPGKMRGEGPDSTYWRDLDLGKQDADAYYRPF